MSVPDASTHVSGLRIKIRFEHLAIHGRVIDTAGKPVVDATVTSTLVDELWMAGPGGVTDETGAFTLEDVPPGAYRLTATSHTGEGRVTGIEAGARDVTIRLTAHGAIDGTLAGFTSPPTVRTFSRDEDSFASFTANVSGSTFHIASVPAGSYVVVAQGDDDRESAMVEVRAGETATVTLDRGAGVTLSGKVIDSVTHQPVEDVSCSAIAESFQGSGRFGGPTGPSGAFTIEHVRPGRVRVQCGAEHVFGSAVLTVGDAPASIEVVVAREPVDDTPARDPGLVVDNKLGDVVVTSVTSGGAAAKSGLLVGDVIVRVGSFMVGRNQADDAYTTIVSGPFPVSIVVERGEQTLTFALAL